MYVCMYRELINSQKSPKLRIFQYGPIWLRKVSTIRSIVLDNNRM